MVQRLVAGIHRFTSWCRAGVERPTKKNVVSRPRAFTATP